MDPYIEGKTLWTVSFTK